MSSEEKAQRAHLSNLDLIRMAVYNIPHDAWWLEETGVGKDCCTEYKGYEIRICDRGEAWLQVGLQSISADQLIKSKLQELYDNWSHEGHKKYCKNIEKIVEDFKK